jgi:hypothetical protein
VAPGATVAARHRRAVSNVYSELNTLNRAWTLIDRYVAMSRATQQLVILTIT